MINNKKNHNTHLMHDEGEESKEEYKGEKNKA